MYMLSNKTRDLIKAKFSLKNKEQKTLDGINVRDFTIDEDKEDLSLSLRTSNNITDSDFDLDKYSEINENNVYYYLGETSLNPGEPILRKDQQVNICIYSINNDYIFPYLEFCLQRENTNLNWLNHKCSGENDFKIIQQKLNKDFDNLSYKGFYIDETNETNEINETDSVGGTNNISLW